MVLRNKLTGAIPTNVDKLYVPWTVADDGKNDSNGRTYSAIFWRVVIFYPPIWSLENSKRGAVKSYKIIPEMVDVDALACGG